MTAAHRPSLVQTLSLRWRRTEASLHARVRKLDPHDEEGVDRLIDETCGLQREIEAQIARARPAGPDDAAAILDLVFAMWSAGGPGTIRDRRDVKLLELARAALRRGRPASASNRAA